MRTLNKEKISQQNYLSRSKATKRVGKQSYAGFAVTQASRL